MDPSIMCLFFFLLELQTTLNIHVFNFLFGLHFYPLQTAAENKSRAFSTVSIFIHLAGCWDSAVLWVLPPFFVCCYLRFGHVEAVICYHDSAEFSSGRDAGKGWVCLNTPQTWIILCLIVYVGERWWLLMMLLGKEMFFFFFFTSVLLNSLISQDALVWFSYFGHFMALEFTKHQKLRTNRQTTASQYFKHVQC